MTLRHQKNGLHAAELSHCEKGLANPLVGKDTMLSMMIHGLYDLLTSLKRYSNRARSGSLECAMGIRL